ELARGNFAAAVKQADLALELTPGNQDLLAIKKDGEKQLQLQQETKAQATESVALRKQNQERVAGLLAEAEQQLDQGDLVAARSNLDTVLAIDAQNKGAAKLLRKIEEREQRQTKTRVSEKMDEADELYDQGNYELAARRLSEVLVLCPDDAKARKYLAKVEEKLTEQEGAVSQAQRANVKERADQLFQEGLDFDDAGDIRSAVQSWNEVLELDPDHERAKTYLQETADRYEKFKAEEAKQAQESEVEQAALKKMKTRITVSTEEPMELADLLNTLSIFSGINFYIAQGISARVQGVLFEDKPLEEILDTVLTPEGLKWQREGDVITITIDLKAHYVRIRPEDMPTIKRMLAPPTYSLQHILWGSEKPSVAAVDLLVDEIENTVFLYDSATNIQKLEKIISEIDRMVPAQLTYQTFRIKEAQGPKIKALLEALLRAQEEQGSVQREIVLEGTRLIVRDTPQNIRRAEELMRDEGFIRDIEAGILEVGVFDLTPRDILAMDQPTRERFAAKVKEVVQTMLYTRDGINAARRAGRKMWFNDQTMQMTITDYNENIVRVADYVGSLAETRKTSRSKIIFLKYAEAAILEERINVILGLAEGTDTVAGGNSVTWTVRVEDEKQFRELTLRVTQVNENEEDNDNDDSVELVVRTATDSRDVTIEEFRSEFIDNEYEINVIEVTPSSSRVGEGRARIQVTYTPTELVEAPEPTEEVLPEEVFEEAALSINVFEDLNALLIRYTDPSLFAEVLSWIDELDRPTKQVTVIMKLVHVNDNRAKQLASELDVINVGEQSMQIHDRFIDASFGDYMGEITNSFFEPGIESVTNAPYLKGTTVLNLLFGGEMPIEWRLRAFEAEGIVTVVNGPRVSVLNNQTADFEISESVGTVNTTGGGDGVTAGEFGGERAVVSVSPVITELGSITLDLDIELRDPVKDIGGRVTSPFIDPRFGAGHGIGSGIPGQGVIIDDPGFDNGFNDGGATVVGASGQSWSTRIITTQVRVDDGGTIVLGGWVQEHTRDLKSGVPILSEIPYVGRMIFGRMMKTSEKTTLLIFLTAKIID
ncbi:hypothetical protein ACFL34_03440, partial [Candidatus Sumerlaeota bacterium]